MSFAVHWELPFVSFDGTPYTIYIHENNYTGQRETLVGAKDVFETQENYSDDIFSPIRYQTGYIRIIVEDITLMERIIPANDVEKMVTLVSYNQVKWRGFLCAQMYTQPYENKHMIEIPVRSILSALDNIYIDESSMTATDNLVKLIVDGFDALVGSSINPYLGMHLNDSIKEGYGLPYTYIRCSRFFTESTNQNEGDTTTEIEGSSYLSILESICTMYGYVAREENNLLYIGYPDTTESCQMTSYDWDNLRAIAAGNTQVSHSTIPKIEHQASESFDIKGAENSISYMNGAKAVAINVNVADNAPLAITLPATTENDDIVTKLQNVNNANVYIQTHQPRDNSFEQYNYSKYINGTYQGVSNYFNMIAHSVINAAILIPDYTSPPTPVYTGAIPIRWASVSNLSQLPILKNGLFMTLGVVGTLSSARPCYAIQSKLQYFLKSGTYLRINFQLNGFFTAISTPSVCSFNPGQTRTNIYCKLSVGNNYWNGNSWVTDNSAVFGIAIENESIITNKTSDNQSELGDGWFIPIIADLSGFITLTILDINDNSYQEQFVISYAKILSELIVSQEIPRNVVASDRQSNVYRRTIIGSKYSQDIEVTNNIGSFNNNSPSSAFILSSNGDTIQGYPYYTDQDRTNTRNQRPEMNVLERMIRYHNSSKKVIILKGATQDSLLETRFLIDGKKYLAIDANHNWADNNRSIKLIEMTS